MRRILLAAVMLTTAACGGIARPDEASRPRGATGGEQRYEATALVLGNENHGPMLCLGAIALSLPPQCGDVRVTNWDWDGVPGEQHDRGTTWGDYHVTGTYDGESFTLDHAGPAQGAPPSDDGGDPIDTPCDEPEGGWVAPDPSRTSEADRQAASRAAGEEPDFAGLWIDYVGDPKPEDLDADPTSAEVILNMAFTGDIERHREELGELWGGPLCVVQLDRTEAELQRIQGDLEPSADELGIQVIWSSIEVVENIVEVGVVAIDAEGRAALDERYGPGAVRPVPALTPIDE
jgi:hypothetical protein